MSRGNEMGVEVRKQYLQPLVRATDAMSRICNNVLI